jgi:hypothetical protein
MWSPSVMVEGTSSRRQIAGFAPRSVTLRLTMVVPALVFSVLVFVVLSGWSSIGAASQRSRIKWTSITENREIKKTRPSSRRVGGN